MKIFRNIQGAKVFTNRSTVAIGNFDGVHLGHRKVIARAKEMAESNKFGIITFEPHPRDYFLRNSKPFKLTSPARKYDMLKEAYVDFVIELKFDKQLEKYSPEEFVARILVKHLGVKNVIVGEDFRFGYKRSGDLKKLKDLGKRYGFNAFSVELENNSDGIISSTLIRTALEQGKVREAKDMLGYWHSIYGEVIRGEKRGREFGFPTANIELKEILVPKFGVYACMIEILTGDFVGLYKGAASIGERPTFGKNEANLEVHIFDFSYEIYGAQVAISLINFQRPEKKFKGIEKLIKQMRLDCEMARKWLSIDRPGQ